MNTETNTFSVPCMKQLYVHVMISTCWISALLFAGYTRDSLGCLITERGTRRSMHLDGSKRAANLSQPSYTRHGLQMGCILPLDHQTLSFTSLTSDTMLTDHLSRSELTIKESLKLRGTILSPFSYPFLLTWTLGCTGLYKILKRRYIFTIPCILYQKFSSDKSLLIWAVHYQIWFTYPFGTLHVHCSILAQYQIYLWCCEHSF